jgi:predicted MPP superfamily phosphohydrolase
MRPHPALIAAGAALAVWAGWIEPRRLVVRRETLSLRGWPRALDGLRAGVMADFHSGVPHMGRPEIARAVARLAAESPDLLLLLGDYVDASPLWGGRLAPEAIAGELGALRTPLGTYAVLGNHDWRAAPDRMWTALETAGITVLENRAVPVDAPGGRLWVAGLADMRNRRSDVAAALRDVPDDPSQPVLLLSHDPDAHPGVPARVALTLAGHVHGGQVAIPILRRLAIPSRHGERYARRHHDDGGRRLYVSSGLGTSGMPVRLLAPPEVVLLELRYVSRTPSCDRMRRRMASDDA